MSFNEALKKDFLNEETRCEFFVSGKRKRIWKCELDLIEELIRVCDKYGLKYYASNGTLLGAVRHSGFVPWDDDVDIMMPRNDYDRLLKLAGEEFKDPYFLQYAGNDKQYFRDYARLRNKNTTAKTKRGWNKKSCHGIFIDIFPIDGESRNAIYRKWQKIRVRYYCALANTYVYYDEFSDSFIRKLLYSLANSFVKRRSFDKLLEKIDNIRKKVPFDKADNVYIICHGGKLINFPKEYLEGNCIREFEYIHISIPSGYDKLLSLHYGDYMELPPLEVRGEHHNIFFDPDHSYKKYEDSLPLEIAKKQFNDY